MTFLANDSVSLGPMARFMELPESPLLTLNMITPESWMVEAVRSPYDLDNIHLQEVLKTTIQSLLLRILAILPLHKVDLFSSSPLPLLCVLWFHSR